MLIMTWLQKYEKGLSHRTKGWAKVCLIIDDRNINIIPAYKLQKKYLSMNYLYLEVIKIFNIRFGGLLKQIR